MAKLRFRSNIGRLAFRTTPSSNEVDARAAMNNVAQNFQKLVNHIEGITPQVLYDSLVPTFHKSQVLCPTDTGKMKASGYLELVEFRGTPTVQIGYGRGNNPPYTAAVHENLEWRHKAPTRAKWLQVALTEDDGAIQLKIVNDLKRVFE